MPNTSSNCELYWFSRKDGNEPKATIPEQNFLMYMKWSKLFKILQITKLQWRWHSGRTLQNGKCRCYCMSNSFTWEHIRNGNDPCRLAKALIHLLYQKGNKMCVNKYSGISLLLIPYKILPKVLKVGQKGNYSRAWWISSSA